MIITDLINDTLRPKGKFEQKRVNTFSAFWSALCYAFLPAFIPAFEVKEFVFLGFLAIGGYSILNIRKEKELNNDNPEL
jgi:hypothetical protein